MKSVKATQQIENRNDAHIVAHLNSVSSLPEFPRFKSPSAYSSWDYIKHAFEDGIYPSQLPPLVVAEVAEGDYILLDGRLRKIIALQSGLSVAPVQVVSLDTSNIVVSAFKYMIQLHDTLTPIEAAYWMYAIKDFMQYNPIPMPNEMYEFEAAMNFTKMHSVGELSRLSNSLSTSDQIARIKNFEQKKTCR